MWDCFQTDIIGVVRGLIADPYTFRKCSLNFRTGFDAAMCLGW